MAAITSQKQAELQRLKMQETALVQLLTRCHGFKQKLQIEEMQLKSMLHDEEQVDEVEMDLSPLKSTVKEQHEDRAAAGGSHSEYSGDSSQNKNDEQEIS